MKKKVVKEVKFLLETLNLISEELGVIAEGIAEQEEDIERKEGDPACASDLLFIASENIGNEVVFALKEFVERYEKALV